MDTESIKEIAEKINNQIPQDTLQKMLRIPVATGSLFGSEQIAPQLNDNTPKTVHFAADSLEPSVSNSKLNLALLSLLQQQTSQPLQSQVQQPMPQPLPPLQQPLPQPLPPPLQQPMHQSLPPLPQPLLQPLPPLPQPLPEEQDILLEQPNNNPVNTSLMSVGGGYVINISTIYFFVVMVGIGIAMYFLTGDKKQEHENTRDQDLQNEKD